MGFKTKILEAVEAGCWVFVTQSLYDRLPKEVLQACMVVDISSPDTLRDALAKCANQPPPEIKANTELQKSAYANLDEIFLQHFESDGRLGMENDGASDNVTITADPLPIIISEGSADLPPYLASMYVRGKDVFNSFVEPVMRQYLRSIRSPVVLDHGSGIGSMLRAAGNYGCQCVGVDRSPGLLQYCREHVPGALYVGLIGEDDGIHCKDNSVDLAYSYTSLMRETRLSAIYATLREIRRVLKQGSFALIRLRAREAGERLFNQEESTIAFSFSSLRTINRRFPNIPIPRLVSINHHTWNGVPLTTSGIKRMLRRRGFVIINLIPDSDPKSKMIWVLAQKM
jgi:SAM-dependent methyltransferase